jgi:hypothetical protein
MDGLHGLHQETGELGKWDNPIQAVYKTRRYKYVRVSVIKGEENGRI